MSNKSSLTPAQTRADGYYWVRKGQQWEIGQWVAGRWWNGFNGLRLDSVWDEIDERPLTREQVAEIPYYQMNWYERWLYRRQKRQEERAKERVEAYEEIGEALKVLLFKQKH